jgi:hypothetical protein
MLESFLAHEVSHQHVPAYPHNCARMISGPNNPKNPYMLENPKNLITLTTLLIITSFLAHEVSHQHPPACPPQLCKHDSWLFPSFYNNTIHKSK